MFFSTMRAVGRRFRTRPRRPRPRQTPRASSAVRAWNRDPRDHRFDPTRDGEGCSLGEGHRVGLVILLGIPPPRRAAVRVHAVRISTVGDGGRGTARQRRRRRRFVDPYPRRRGSPPRTRGRCPGRRPAEIHPHAHDVHPHAGSNPVFPPSLPARVGAGGGPSGAARASEETNQGRAERRGRDSTAGAVDAGAWTER